MHDELKMRLMRRQRILNGARDEEEQAKSSKARARPSVVAVKRVVRGPAPVPTGPGPREPATPAHRRPPPSLHLDLGWDAMQGAGAATEVPAASSGSSSSEGEESDAGARGGGGDESGSGSDSEEEDEGGGGGAGGLMASVQQAAKSRQQRGPAQGAAKAKEADKEASAPAPPASSRRGSIMDGPEVRPSTASPNWLAQANAAPRPSPPFLPAAQNIQGLSAILQSRTRKDTAEDEWSETASESDSE